jgi:hypothetical protein
MSKDEHKDIIGTNHPLLYPFIVNSNLNISLFTNEFKDLKNSIKNSSLIDQNLARYKDGSSKESSIEAKSKLIPGYSSTKYSKSIKQNFLKRHMGNSSKHGDLQPASLLPNEVKSRNIHIVKSNTSKKEGGIVEIERAMGDRLDQCSDVMRRNQTIQEALMATTEVYPNLYSLMLVVCEEIDITINGLLIDKESKCL